MWRDYAVQPECLVQSKDAFRALFFCFGWEHGRLLAKYPAKDWLRRVYDALGSSSLGDIARSWVVEQLTQGKDRMTNSGRPFDPAISWLCNAEAQQSSLRPFHAIVAMENPHSHPHILLSSDLTDHTPLWCRDGDLTVARTADAIAGAVAPLLQRSARVVLIDPHFTCARRFIRVLERLIHTAMAGTSRSCLIEYHLNVAFDQSEFERKTRVQVGRVLPAGTAIEFYLWRQRTGGEMLHDRFILTNIAGAEVSVGLDEGEIGETTGIKRISRARLGKTLRDFAVSTAAFDLVHRFSVKA